MKRTVLAVLLCSVAADRGLAADLPQAGPPPTAVRYAPAVSYDWSGFYIGVNGGYGVGNSSWNSAAPFTTGNFTTDGLLAGGTIGINYQAGQFVFGFEGDADWAGFKGTSNNAYCSLVTAGAVCQTAEHWLGTARARIGFAVNRLLIFGTAGGASGDIKAGLNPPGTYDASNNFGWTAGGGVEGAITENWTAKIEYLHVDLGNATCPANCGLAVPMTVPLTENLVRAGINYKFGF